VVCISIIIIQTVSTPCTLAHTLHDNAHIPRATPAVYMLVQLPPAETIDLRRVCGHRGRREIIVRARAPPPARLFD